MKKECFSILLPTKEKSGLQLNTIHNHLFSGDGAEIATQPYQHLYICSNEEIKEGDWYIHSGIEWNKPKRPYQNMYQCNKGHRLHNNCKEEGYFVDGFYAADCKKIIATTNKELWSKTPIEGAKGHFLNKPLYSISKNFIQIYIDKYNKREKIEKCMVEYEGIKSFFDADPYPNPYIPKLNGNEIIISECEEKLYTRAEVEAIVRNFATYCGLEHGNYTKPNQWFNKNI